MKKHTKIYFEALGYDPGDFVCCEVCGREAVDIHHIDSRGMGGDPTGSKDVIENLMALCRKCHEEYGDITALKPQLKEMHQTFLDSNSI